MTILEITVAVGTLGMFLLGILAYLIRISAMIGKIVEKVSKIDGLETRLGDMQVNYEGRLSTVEAKVNGKGSRQ